MDCRYSNICRRNSLTEASNASQNIRHSIRKSKQGRDLPL